MATFIEGDPKPQARQKFRSVKSKKGKTLIMPYHTKNEWRESVKSFFDTKDEFYDTAIKVDLNFIFKRPKNHFRSGKFSHLLKLPAKKYVTAKPDRDNLDKAVMDAMENAGIFSNDSIACDGRTSKRYICREYPKAGVYIIITHLEDEINEQIHE
jgi:Holliday junction resolvase RusA-like endonuclease